MFSQETEQLLRDLALYLERIKLSFFSGRLVVNTPERNHSWVFSFHLGRLNWTGGSYYRIDWWRRHLGVAATRIMAQDIQALATFQQPELVSGTLAELLNAQQLDRKYLNEIIAKMFEEAVFDIIQCSHTIDGPLDYEYFYNTSAETESVQTLPLLSCRPHLERAWSKWNLWQGEGLESLPVNLQLQSVARDANEPEELNAKQKQLLHMVMRGYSLRDMCHAIRQPLLDIGKELYPLLQSGAIVVSQGLDVLSMIESIGKLEIQEPITSGFFPKSGDMSEQATLDYQPLIACIDDSEIVHYHLGRILTQHGYRLTSVHDPRYTIPSLLTTKPDLIFLDLVMPTINGYEVCGQIRKTPSLKQVPVIILTGKDGMVDKLRSKLVGASDFVSKPFDEETVLRMLFYYLPVLAGTT
jgi:two-component system, chemotaxis family, response regulator PixG